MFSEAARVCPECGATISADLSDCWLCQARASVPQSVRKESAAEEQSAQVALTSDVKSPIFRPPPSLATDPSLANRIGTALLALASVFVLLLYAAACLGILGLPTMQRIVLAALIVPALLRTISLGGLQGAANPQVLMQERLILFAGSLVAMVMTAGFAVSAFLLVWVPLYILTGINCWNGSKEPTTDLRIQVAFLLALVAGLASAVMIIFETWISYHVFYRPEDGLPRGVQRFLRLQRGAGLVYGSLQIGAAGTWATMVILVNLQIIVPFQKGSGTEGVFILLAVIFFAIWGGLSLAIWTWLLNRGYRIH